MQYLHGSTVHKQQCMKVYNTSFHYIKRDPELATFYKK